VDEKVQRYHDNGVPLVAVIGPKTQVTELCRAGNPRVKLDRPIIEIGPGMRISSSTWRPLSSRREISSSAGIIGTVPSSRPSFVDVSS
jgi:hypothetical protein